ncbi:hypothetical protein BDP55DRAFT_670621 [Colletotrichum godetiae]|uniref:Uncharacterized protein n=1 Tax=Colletotrichum godetiae TaxID=1209918 RepID=A0AAJ0AIY1_9PEZI|nr:uncharacterized protein BDP55DRAFT_670621 [Colletotrichum godetiae]KAK1673232.1 hypothetical protein BDP55DRAFT_670621 [Colletotrichum godetiae]
MARAFGTLLIAGQGRYLAGLWEKQLEKSLPWWQEGVMDIFLPKSQKSRPQEWVAPSWSWASHPCRDRFTLSQEMGGAAPS